MRYILIYTIYFGFFAFILFLPGVLLEKIFLRRFPSDQLRHLVRICLGLSFWMLAVFVLCACRLFTRFSLFLLIGCLLAIGGSLLFLDRQTWRPNHFTVKNVFALKNVPGEVLICGLPLIFMVAAFFALTLSPAIVWDENTYHLTLPKLYLAHHGFRQVTFNVYSNWPLNTEMLFAMAMVVKDYILAKLVHFAIGVLILYEIFLCGQSSQQRQWSWLAMPLYLSNQIVRDELRMAYVDLAYAFFFLASVLFMMQALKQTAEPKIYLALSGLCAGILAGIKLTGILGVVVISLFYLWQGIRNGQFLKGLKPLLVFFYAPVLGLMLPWGIKSLWYTGNPVYPFLFQWFDGVDWSLPLTIALNNWFQAMGMGHSFWDYVLLPVRVILLGRRGYDHFDGTISPIWIVLLPLTMLTGLRNQTVRNCLAIAGLYFVCWSISAQQMRFLIPVLPFLAIASAVTLGELWHRIKESRYQRQGWYALCAGGVMLMLWVSKPEISRSFQSLELYQTQGQGLQQFFIHPVYPFINQHLPADAKILFLNTNHGFFCDREYLADSFFEASQIVDWLGSAKTIAEVLRRLQSRHISHILFWNENWQIPYPPALFEMLQKQQGVTLIYQAEDHKAFLFQLTKN